LPRPFAGRIVHKGAHRRVDVESQLITLASGLMPSAMAIKDSHFPDFHGGQTMTIVLVQRLVAHAAAQR